MAADLVPVGAGHLVAPPLQGVGHHPHLEVRRGHQGETSADLVPVLGLPHLHAAQLIEPVGVHLRKARGHVLGDEHAGDVLRQALHHLQGGLGAPGGGPKADDDPVPRGAPQLGRGHRGHAGLPPGGGGGALHLGPGGNAHLLFQHQHESLCVLHPVGLAHEVHRPGVQGVEDSQIEGRDQHHRQGVLRQQGLEQVQSAHPRHLHVQGHDVGLELLDLELGVHGVDGVAHYLYIWKLAQSVYNHLAGQHGVVHHQHANFISHTLPPVTILFPARQGLTTFEK